jgi:hypothetical protein
MPELIQLDAGAAEKVIGVVAHAGSGGNGWGNDSPTG